MQLSFIELLYVSAQQLHKVKIIKQNPRRRIMQSVLASLGRVDVCCTPRAP
jgi:hypothetical protein